MERIDEEIQDGLDEAGVTSPPKGFYIPEIVLCYPPENGYEWSDQIAPNIVLGEE